MKVSLLDYGAGNVRSVRNAIIANGYEIIDITEPSQIIDAEVIIFPGVGSYGTAMKVLHDKGYIEPLREYLKNGDRPFLGICLGMQTLFESSEETSSHHRSSNDKDTDDKRETIAGLGVIPGKVVKFDESKMKVPHIGWNGRILHQKNSPVFQYVDAIEYVYFVHSFYAAITNENKDWVLTSTIYHGQSFISSIQKNNIVATQFHPEKSGQTGLHIIKGFLEGAGNGTLGRTEHVDVDLISTTQLTKRVVVALDVRTNDDGELVVTKGDQYDVREKSDENETQHNTSETVTTRKGTVRNLGQPVQLASRYYNENIDEIAFLNITSFRNGVIDDMPMLHILENASKNIFVPLTVGGGIRSYQDPISNKTYSALEVAARYFRAGADKVSLGSDAVQAAEAYVASGGIKTGQTSIEMISNIYGAQAVVISIDPKRVYVASKADVDPKHVVVSLENQKQLGPKGEQYCWYQCTVKGGREARDICAITVCKICEILGAGEIMLNCIDMDGQGNGYDIPLMNAVSNAVTIPIIASSGAGKSQHVIDVFQQTNVEAALAAGMFHRREVQISDVKRDMKEHNIPVR